MKLFLVSIFLFAVSFAHPIPAAQEYTNISVSELSERLNQAGPLLMINVHIPYEGEIEGTDVFIPFNQLEAFTDILPTRRDTEIILYCLSGRMSEIAAETLLTLGYSNVHNVVGGMGAWEAAGFTLQHTAPSH
ncbi:MAG: rhodanese-like domain-containing protein [Deinococcota bacterium]